jgi:hypothetical protein
MSQPQRRAQVTIYTDDTFKVDWQFQGDPVLTTALIGSMESVKLLLLKHIITAAPGQPPAAQTKVEVAPERQPVYTGEQSLPRDRAIEAYEYAKQAMELRLEKIRNAPPDQTFLVDHSLLSKL